MSSQETWKTSITNIAPNRILVRGAQIDEMMGKVSFAQAVYLVLKGELPNQNEGKMIDAILVSSIDHGVTPPSTLAARTVASCGVPLTAALASGILAIGSYHGGAVEDCMRTLLQAVERKAQNKKDFETTAKEIVHESKQNGKKIFGYGHRVHGQDPRTAKLFKLAEELGFFGDYLQMAKAIEEALFIAQGKRLPLNVDGAIAALLCEMKFPPELGNAFFIIARIPGLIAHIYEEKIKEKPMRIINPTKWEYDGPAHL
ncbi:MAG: citryl-CoA lyase [Candidatus Edwardsbacteria bacterium]